MSNSTDLATDWGDRLIFLFEQIFTQFNSFSLFYLKGIFANNNNIKIFFPFLNLQLTYHVYFCQMKCRFNISSIKRLFKPILCLHQITDSAIGDPKI